MNYKHKTLSALLAATMVFSLAGCGSASSAAPASSAAASTPASSASTAAASFSVAESDLSDAALQAIAKIKEKGVLTISTESKYAPFCFKDNDLNIVGFEPTLMQYLADDLGVKLNIQDVDFTAVIPAVTSGEADIGMAGMVKTAERAEVVDFTQPYHMSGQCVMVLKDNAATFTSFDSFAGKTLGAQKGTLQETILHDQFPDSNAKILDKVPDLVQLLQLGEIDGLIIAVDPAGPYLASHEELATVDPGIVVDPETNGQVACVAKGNEGLVEYLNAVFAKLSADGTLDGWYADAVTLSNEQNAA